MVISCYQKRLSGPLLDRAPAPRASAGVDIRVEVPPVSFQKLSDERRGELSAAIRARAETARAGGTECFAGTKLICSADIGRRRSSSTATSTTPPTRSWAAWSGSG